MLGIDRFNIKERRIKAIIDYVNLVIFFLLFSVDAIWYMASQVAAVPKIPVGFLSLISVALFILPYCLMRYRRFVFYFSIMFIFLIFSGIAAFQSQYADWEWINMFWRYVSIFSCGYLISASGIFKTKIGRWGLLLSTLFCVILSIIYLRKGWDPDGEFNYLRTAGALLSTAIFSIFYSRGVVLKIIIYIGVLVSLTLINSRTFLYLWLLLPALVFVAGQIRSDAISLKRVVYLVPVIAMIFIVIHAIVNWVLPELAAFGNARLLPNIEILAGDGFDVETTDNSIRARRDFSHFGWQQIMENPVFGYYNGFLSYGGPGSYMHNILSYWHQFGLIPFIIVVYMIASAFRHQFKIGKSSQNDATKVFLITTVIASLAARAYVSIELFFAIGLALGSPVAQKAWRGPLRTRNKPTYLALRAQR